MKKLNALALTYFAALALGLVLLGASLPGSLLLGLLPTAHAEDEVPVLLQTKLSDDESTKSAKSAPAIAEKGVSVTPSIIKLDLSKSTSTEILYENNTNSNIEIRFSASDFTEMEDGWKVKFLDKKDSQNYKYSLASWIKFDRESVTLGPLETAKVKVFFEKDRLSQGGHYASILGQIIPLESEKSGSVSVKSILATLVFVSGGTESAMEQGEVSSFTPKRMGDYLFPESYSLRFKNTGNVQLTPHGSVEVRDVFGELVAKGILNEGSLLVLPETIRAFDIKLTVLRAFVSPGMYNAKIVLRYGEAGDKFLETKASFFTFGSSTPLQLLISIVALVVALVIIFKLLERRFRK